MLQFTEANLNHRESACDFLVRSSDQKQSDVLGFLEGMASTPQVDSYNEIIVPEAFLETMPEYMQFPILLFGHHWSDKPIGKTVAWAITSNGQRLASFGDVPEGQLADGLWVRAAIVNTEEGRDVWLLIGQGILKSFSVGFWTITYENNSAENKPSRILKLKLAENSVVNRPANSGALFEAAKKQKLALKSFNQISRRDGNGGTQKMEVDVVKTIESALAPVSAKVDDAHDLIEKQGLLIKEHIDKQNEVNKNAVTKAEFADFNDKIGKQMLDNAEALKRIEKQKRLDTESLPTSEFRGSIRGLMDYRDDSGNPWGDAQKREYRLFQMPFKKRDGWIADALQEIREANDVLVILDAMARANGRPLNLRETKSFKRIQELAGSLDPDFAKAMYVGTGVGTEWVPTGWSGELFDLIYLEAKVASLFPAFTMTQNPYIWPIKTSRPTVYRASAVSSNSPDSIIRSDAGTNKITFTAELFACAVLMDPVLLEDAIISVLDTIRQDTAIALALADDSRIVNADDTATHQDNASATRWAAGSPETYEKGLRKIALAASAKSDAQSASAGIGDATSAFVAKDVRYARQKMGVLGIDPSKVAYVCSARTYYQILNFVEQTQGQLYYLMAGSWKTGLNLPFDGCELVVTSAIDENQAATGLYTDGSAALSSLLAVRKDGFKRGQRRQVTVEVAKDISTQGVLLVSTKRESFQKMTPSTQTPVWVVYNIPA